MRAPTRFVSLVLICLATAGTIAVGQELSVNYLQGPAQVKEGSGWSALSSGQSLKPPASLRLSSGALVELTGKGPSILLSQPGVYPVAHLVSLVQRMHPAGLDQALSSALARVVAPAKPAPGGPVSAPWYRGPSRVFLKGGQESLAAHDYARAAAELTRGLQFATPTAKPTFRVFLAYAHALQGDPVKALKDIEPLPADSGASWFPDLAVLKAKLLLDGFAFHKAVDLLNRYSAGIERGATRAPLASLLLALGYRGLSDTSKERTKLQQAITRAPGSDLARAAKQLLAAP